jgi:bifunctional DNA-binding transcriptional regulator/antitoxin component of YhaV-PrlF toxin-antitoxin module
MNKFILLEKREKEALLVAKGITRKLQRTPKDQYTLTIPKTLVQILGWNDKDEIEFIFEKDKLSLRRVKKK